MLRDGKIHPHPSPCRSDLTHSKQCSHPAPRNPTLTHSDVEGLYITMYVMAPQHGHQQVVGNKVKSISYSSYGISTVIMVEIEIDNSVNLTNYSYYYKHVQ